MEELTDEQLVERYRRDAASAAGRRPLEELFRRHRTRVSAWCYRLTGDVDSAADLAQDIFLKAFQRLDSFRGDSRFTTWLYSITRNHCMDELRARAGRSQEMAEAVLDEVADQRSDFSRDLERQESQGIVRELIRESLDETETKVITLHYVDEIPLDAITRILGLTNQSGSKAYIVSARRKLGRALERWRHANETKGGRRGL